MTIEAMDQKAAEKIGAAAKYTAKEALDRAIYDEIREAPIDEWDAWDEACMAAGVDLINAIICHEDFEYDVVDGSPRFDNCNVLEIAATVAAAL